VGTTTVPALQDAVRRIVAAVAPERVWLYGSRARGDHHPDSDWDLMLVMPGAGAPAAWVTRVATKEADAAGLDVTDIHAMSHEDFHDRLHLRASFPSTIAREGRILYQAVDMAERDARRWLERARQDLDAVRRLVSPAEPDMATTIIPLLHLAAERAAKALLAWHDLPSRRTHDIALLAGHLRESDPEAAACLHRLRRLTRLGPAMRYPSDTPVPGPRSVAMLVRATSDAVALAASRLPPA
jgi:predicted nucleotidyltransferase/HEPN domain-containing protein